MKNLLLLSIIFALPGGVRAGDWGKAPVMDKAPVEECLDLGGTIGVGYHTNYIFRGIRLAGDTVSANVNYTFDGLLIPTSFGINYFNGITNDIASATGFASAGFDQLALTARAALGTYAGFDLGLGYTHYLYPEFRSNVAAPPPFKSVGFGELGFQLRRSLGFADLVGETNYAFGSPTRGAFGGWYHQIGLERNFGLTDHVGLTLGAGLAYSDHYLEPVAARRGSGWNHYYLMAELPVQLNCRTVLTPYIGYIGAPQTWIAHGAIGTWPETQSDIIHGGVKLSVSF